MNFEHKTSKYVKEVIEIIFLFPSTRLVGCSLQPFPAEQKETRPSGRLLVLALLVRLMRETSDDAASRITLIWCKWETIWRPAPRLCRLSSQISAWHVVMQLGADRGLFLLITCALLLLQSKVLQKYCILKNMSLKEQIMSLVGSWKFACSKYWCKYWIKSDFSDKSLEFNIWCCNSWFQCNQSGVKYLVQM